MYIYKRRERVNEGYMEMKRKGKEIIEDIDLNADGEVDFEEFKQLMAGSREIIEENRGTQKKNV